MIRRSYFLLVKSNASLSINAHIIHPRIRKGCFSWKHRLYCNEEIDFIINHRSGIFYDGQSNYEEFDNW